MSNKGASSPAASRTSKPASSRRSPSNLAPLQFRAVPELNRLVPISPSATNPGVPTSPSSPQIENAPAGKIQSAPAQAGPADTGLRLATPIPTVIHTVNRLELHGDN